FRDRRGPDGPRNACVRSASAMAQRIEIRTGAPPLMSVSPAPNPKISRTPRFPLVWVVPLIALAVGAWMIAHELRNRGPEITIEFADGAGMAAERTELQHKGVSVGTVTAVELKPNLDGVMVRVRLRQTAAAIASEGALFWIVQPEIGLSGIRGLDTLLTGPRL